MGGNQPMTDLPPAVIRVTADHIARGAPRNPSACPVALAIKGQIPGIYAIEVEVSDVTIRPTLAFRWWTCVPPDSAADFINAFDAGEPVEPFEFEAEWTDQDGKPPMTDPDDPPDYQHPDEDPGELAELAAEADWWAMWAGDDEYVSEAW
jgi:hypothetical protein